MYDWSEGAPIFDANSSPVSDTSIARFGSTELYSTPRLA